MNLSRKNRIKDAIKRGVYETKNKNVENDDGEGEGGTATLSQVVETLDNLNKAWEEFKSANDERLAKLEKKGVSVKEGGDRGRESELEEKLSKIGKALDEQKERQVRLEASLRRAPKGKSSETGEDEPEDATEVKSSFRAFLRKGKGAAEGGEFRYEKKSMSVLSDPDGGFSVTADMSGRVATKVFETSPVRQVASVTTIGTDALEGDYDLDEAAAAWVGEVETRSESNTPQVGRWRIPVHEQQAMPKATQKLLDDSNFNVEEWLARKVADKFARSENLAFVSGNGVGKPRGFLTYTSGTTLPGTIEQKNSGSSGVVVADTLIDLVYLLKMPYRGRAKWAFSRTTQAAIRKLKDSQNQYLWSPGVGPTQGLGAGAPATLLGYAITEMADIPDPAANSLSAVFADFAEMYQIVDRVGIRVIRDPYTSKGFILFYTTKRVGGDVVNFEAGKIYKLA